jgi:hypothetical protein
MDLVNKAVSTRYLAKAKLCELTEQHHHCSLWKGAKEILFPTHLREHLYLVEKKSRQYVGAILDEADKDLRSKREEDMREQRRGGCSAACL